MAIRIRNINGTMIALCAAETDAKNGDIYLDDNIHYALATKFSDDWKLGFADKALLKLIAKEKVRDAKDQLNDWLNSIHKD